MTCPEFRRTLTLVRRDAIPSSRTPVSCGRIAPSPVVGSPPGRQQQLPKLIMESGVVGAALLMRPASSSSDGPELLRWQQQEAHVAAELGDVR